MASETQIFSALTAFKHFVHAMLAAVAWPTIRGLVVIVSASAKAVLLLTRYYQVMEAQTSGELNTLLRDGRKEVAFYESVCVPLAMKVVPGHELILDASSGLVAFIICQIVSFLLLIPSGKCLFDARADRSHFIALGAVIQKIPALSVLSMLLYIAASQLSAGATIAFTIMISLIIVLLIVTWFKVDVAIGGAILGAWAMMCRACLGHETDNSDEEHEMNALTGERVAQPIPTSAQEMV